MEEQATLERDCRLIAQQEKLLRFGGPQRPAFDEDVAWRLGTMLRERGATAVAARRVTVADAPGCSIEIERAGQLLFAAATAGASPTQANWIRRKRNTVHRFERSSYGVGRELALAGVTLQDRDGLPEADFATHGGGFPIFVEDGDDARLVGSVVFSGLPQREDHAIVVDALSELLGVEVPRLD